MRRVSLLMLLALLVGAASASASPFLVCDPQPGQGVQWYVVTGLPAAVDGSHVAVDVSGQYGFKLDLGPLPSGSYTVKAKACKGDTTWGEVCSADSLPFAFSRPGPLTAPGAARLAP